MIILIKIAEKFSIFSSWLVTWRKSQRTLTKVTQEGLTILRIKLFLMAKISSLQLPLNCLIDFSLIYSTGWTQITKCKYLEPRGELLKSFTRKTFIYLCMNCILLIEWNQVSLIEIFISLYKQRKYRHKYE